MAIFILPFCSIAGSLKPGLYRDFKPTKPLMLEKGSYTFINLEMKNLGKGIWLDARKATSLTLLQCSFESLGLGTGLAVRNQASVQNCEFKNLEIGILATRNKMVSKKKSQSRTGNTFTNLDYGILVPSALVGTDSYKVRGNTFDGNRFGVYLGTGNYNMELKCNVFKETEGIALGSTHVGLLISENANLAGNRIGGSPTTDPVGSPNANRWPLNSIVWNSTTTPTTIDGFVSIKTRPRNWYT